MEQKERAALGPVSVDTSIAKARKGESVKTAADRNTIAAQDHNRHQ
jgi:hypothetical protein